MCIRDRLEIGDFPINPVPGREQLHNQLLMTRPAFGGNTIATIACPNFRPQMATVRPGVMQKAERVEGAQAVIEEFNPGFVPNDKYVEILEVVKAVSEVEDIMDAQILVSGGRGVGSAENFKLLEDLAAALGGTVSCSCLLYTSGINDGAAAVVVMSEEKAKDLGVKPMATWVTGALAGVCLLYTSRCV